MFWRIRSFWIAAGAVAYVAFAALNAAEVSPAAEPLVFGRAPAWLALFGLPVALAIGWTLTSPPARGEDRVDAGARSAARACLAGAAILIAARTGPEGTSGAGSAGFVALGNLGAAIASSASLWGLSRISSLGGILEPLPSARRLDAAAFGALFWTVAVALP